MDWKSKLKDILQSIKTIYAKVKDKVLLIWDRCKPTMKKAGAVLRDAGYVFKLVGRWAYKLRSLFLAIPVAFAAIALALKNMQSLPEQVGIDLLANGEYAYTISRGMAVFGPLLITGICLLLMACSRRVIYPWLISIFSLALPLVIMLTTVLAG